jgi:hypothetical protein
VVDPICPARHREPAGLVEQQSAAAVHSLVDASRFGFTSRSQPSRSCPSPKS